MTNIGQHLADIAERKTNPPVRFSEQLAKWSETRLPHFKEASRDCMRSRLAVCGKYFSARELRDCAEPDELDAFMAWLSADGYAVRSIKAIRGDLLLVLRDAHRRRLLPEPPYTPGIEKIFNTPKPFLTVEQMRQLIAEADEKYKPIYGFLCETGLRIGEAMAVRREDFSQEKGYNILTVSRSRYRKNEQTPKTEAAQRKLAVSMRLMALLPKQGLIFADSDGRLVHLKTLAKRLQKAGFKLGVAGIHPHSLRASSGTALNSMGMLPANRRYRLGHSQVGVTDRDYTVVQIETDVPLVEKFGELLFA